MAAKIVLFVLVVTVCKVQSHVIYYPNPQSSTASSNAKTSSTASTSSSNGQSAPTQATSQSQTYPAKSSNPNQGLKASSQLQLVPGQKLNLQAIPVSKLQGFTQQKGQNQNSGYSIPIAPRPCVQASPTPQIQTSPAQLIQPSLNGPASVITSPVSSITIPPSTTTTVFDHSLCNSLANALQMMIANEFINSAINNNIIKEGIQIPIVETPVPTFDLATFLKGLNAQQIQQASSQPETPQAEPQYDWAAIQNFLNKQAQEEKPKEDTAPTDVANLMNYFQQYGQTAEQIQQQTNSQSAPAATDSQNYSQPAVTESSQQTSSPQNSYDNALETLAAYFGCNVSDLCTSSNPCVPQIALPEEIPAQLICNYGYMPTAVPVVSFSVQPLNGGDGNFIVGCKC